MGLSKNGSLKAAAGVAAVGFAAGMAVNPLRKLAHQGMEVAVGKNDWLEILKLEHRAVDEMFSQLLQTKDDEVKKRTALLAGIKIGLTKHALQEEDVVYPALREQGVEAETKELYSEHADIKTYLHELETKPKDDPTWLSRAESFATLVRHHVREEEDEIYPNFKEKLSAEQNKQVTKRMNIEGLLLA